LPDAGPGVVAAPEAPVPTDAPPLFWAAAGNAIRPKDERIITCNSLFDFIVEFLRISPCLTRYFNEYCKKIVTIG
jgi:hypothetical protein